MVSLRRLGLLLVSCSFAACRHTPSAGPAPSASSPSPATSNAPAASSTSAPTVDPLAIRNQADCPEGMLFVPGADLNLTQRVLGKKSDEPRPQHFHVANFCIDRTEVPRPKWRPDLCGAPEPGCMSTVSWDVPMVCIEHEQADCYCARATAGIVKRLPSDPEWLLAAYGTDGRTFPWGNESPEGVQLGRNFCPYLTQQPGEASLCPPESNVLDRSPYGVIGMQTNGMEMTGSCAVLEAAPDAPPHCILRGGGGGEYPEIGLYAIAPIRGPASSNSSQSFRCVVSRRADR